MSRESALRAAESHFDSGEFIADLTRRVVFPTESAVPEQRHVLESYLSDEMAPTLERMGYSWRVVPNSSPVGGPFLIASRIEDERLPTVLTYGHGDVVRGMPQLWSPGLSPWTLKKEGDCYFGRGTADNKAQHSIVLAALRTTLEVRGWHGFNSKVLIDMGEEIGSPGLEAVVRDHADELRADLFLASDGPRLRMEYPDIKLGNRGAVSFDLVVRLREGSRHSGHWGGVLEDPGIILAHALASMVTKRGRIQISQWRPREIPPKVKAALSFCEVDPGGDFPHIAADWGEPGLTRSEKMFGWTSFIVLAFVTGQPDRPVNGVQPWARASCQVRFTIDIEAGDILSGLRKHLDEHGFDQVQIATSDDHFSFPASRTDPGNHWVSWATQSIERTTGANPIVVPNGAGSLPSHIFADVLGVPTIWVPHSYAGCKQHGPDEHVLGRLMRDGLRIMTGLFWDLGAGDGIPAPEDANASP